MVFTYKKRIFGYECDIYGHMNNANYLQLLEAARSEALIDMDIPLSDLKQKGVQLFIYRVEMDYLRSVELEDVITVKSSFFEINRLKGRWRQEVYNSKGDKCFEAILTIVFAAEGKAKRLPQDVFEHFARFLEQQG